MYRTSSVHWRNGTDAEGHVERRQGYHHTARTVLKDRLREDRGTIIQPGQLNTTKPVGVYFGQQGLHKSKNDPIGTDPIKRSNGSDQEIQ